MAPGLHVSREFARYGELAWRVAVLAVLLVALLLSLAASYLLVRRAALAKPRTGLRWHLHRRTARLFANAVAHGDSDGAEAAAQRVLGRHHRPRMPLRSRVVSWDERVILRRNPRLAAAELRRGGGLAAWCPHVRKVPARNEMVIAVGHRSAVRLEVLSRRWTAQGTEVVVDADGIVFFGRLTLRPAPGRRGTLNDDERVEVWAHCDGPPSRRSRRLLRQLRRTAKAGLHRWTCEHTSLSGQHRPFGPVQGSGPV